MSRTIRPDTTRLRRRGVLRALSAAGLLPLARGGWAFAQPGGSPPRRLIFFYTPNGTIIPEWRPRPGATPRDFTLGRILRPLERHRDKLLVLGGVNMALADSGFGSHHTRGMGGLLTGRPILRGTFQSAGPPTAGWGSGISVDQHIAKVVGASTRFRSLELGVRVIDAEVRGRLSYLGANQPLPPMESPQEVYGRLFAGLGGNAGPPNGSGGPENTLRAERLLAQRKSVIDYVKDELGRVAGEFGGEDRQRLDAHLTAVRDIERRLGTALPGTPGAGGACSAPAQPTGAPLSQAADMPAIGELQMDFLTAAMACDLVRVATLQWTHAESNQTFPWLGINGQHHTMSHAGDQDAAAQESLTKINVWYGEQMAALLDRLAATREGDGTLLDHTAVVWVIEVGKGNNHAHRDLPFVIAGSCGGAFRTGRFVDYLAGGGRGHPHNNLLVSLANAMGLPDTTFGDPAHCTGPLPDLG